MWAFFFFNDLNPAQQNTLPLLACSDWSIDPDKQPIQGESFNTTLLLFPFQVTYINRSLFCVATQTLSELLWLSSLKVNSAECLLKQKVGRSAGGRAGGQETVMINHQRGLCEADSITSLDCSTVGKVSRSIGGLQLPRSLQERQN